MISNDQILQLLNRAHREGWRRLALFGQSGYSQYAPQLLDRASGWDPESVIINCERLSSSSSLRLGQLTGLRFLTLYDDMISPADMACLSGLSSLTHLDLGECSIGSQGAAALAKLITLYELDLYQCDIGPDGAAHLAGLVNLTKLELESCRIRDEGAACLARLRNLQELDLTGCMIGSEGVRHLASLDRLVALNLSGCEIGPEGARHLAGLPALQGLTLTGCKIGDEGIECLANLHNLVILELQDNALTSFPECVLKLPKLIILRIDRNPDLGVANDILFKHHNPTELWNMVRRSAAMVAAPAPEATKTSSMEPASIENESHEKPPTSTSSEPEAVSERRAQHFRSTAHTLAVALERRDERALDRIFQLVDRLAGSSLASKSATRLMRATLPSEFKTLRKELADTPRALFHFRLIRILWLLAGRNSIPTMDEAEEVFRITSEPLKTEVWWSLLEDEPEYRKMLASGTKGGQSSTKKTGTSDGRDGIQSVDEQQRAPTSNSEDRPDEPPRSMDTNGVQVPKWGTIRKGYGLALEKLGLKDAS